jgi:deoxyadenosine/deoxycytidine kinase
MAYIISIEGNIGSGKSTFLSYLKENCSKQLIFVKEPVDKWEQIRDSETNESMLQKFYKDQKKYSFSFQMMAFISRFSILRETVRQNPSAIIITERCLYTDKYVFAKMLFEMKNIEDINYQIYNQWFEEFASEFPVNKIIYIKANPEICFERIKKRNRIGESVIPLDYLINCHQYHEDMIEILSSTIEIIYIDGNIDIYENPTMIREWVNQCEL